jgi:hypothetical protein
LNKSIIVTAFICGFTVLSHEIVPLITERATDVMTIANGFNQHLSHSGKMCHKANVIIECNLALVIAARREEIISHLECV